MTNRSESFMTFLNVIEIARLNYNDPLNSLHDFFKLKNPNELELAEKLFLLKLTPYSEVVLIRMIGDVTAAPKKRISKYRDRYGSYYETIHELYKSKTETKLTLDEVYSVLTEESTTKREQIEDLLMKCNAKEAKSIFHLLETGHF